MLYFAYGSNMSIKRLQARLPSAKFVAIATLSAHELAFHKVGRDNSGKCDAFATGNASNTIMGIVYEINASEKPVLDKYEDLACGYDEKIVALISIQGVPLKATTYYAIKINARLKPFHWYKAHVLRGATENNLPSAYIEEIARVEAIDDSDWLRHDAEMAIYD